MPRFRSILLGAIAAVAGPAGHALIMSPSWLLTADSGAQFGYDSNIFDSHVPVADGVITGTQNFLLRRRSGTTHFSVGANLSDTYFLDHHDQDSVDGGLTITYAFPADDTFSILQPGKQRTADTYIAPPDNSLPSRTTLRASWYSVTEANQDVGSRLRSERTNLSAENDWYAVPKLLWSNTATYSRIDYADNRYVSNDSFLLASAVLHDWRPDARWGGEYDAQFGQSSAAGSALPEERLQVHSLSLAADGILLPKVYGRATAGFSAVRYTGRTNESGLNPRFSFGLTWEGSPLTKLLLDGGYEYGFSPDGYAVRRTTVSVSLVRQIAAGYTLQVGLAPARAVFPYGGSTRTDDELRATVSVTYRFTERLDAALTTRGTWITSSQTARTFNRTELFANINYHY
jgi:hypothetical protein